MTKRDLWRNPGGVATPIAYSKTSKDLCSGFQMSPAAAQASHVEWSGLGWRWLLTSATEKTGRIRISVVSIALSIVFGFVSVCLERLSAQDQKASATMSSSKRMADGKQWMTRNLDVTTAPSYCYDDAELHCRQYGRL